MFQEKAKHYKGQKRSKIIFFLLAVDICICICILLAAWAVFLNEPQTVALESNSAPLDVELNQTPILSNAESESGETSESDGSANESSANSNAQKNGGGSADISFAKEVSIFLTSKTVILGFGNGENSSVDVVVQLLVQDQVLAKSGKLTPGNEINQLALTEGSTSFLSVGSYEGSLRFECYDRETGKKTPIASKIPVTVTVQN